MSEREKHDGTLMHSSFDAFRSFGRASVVATAFLGLGLPSCSDGPTGSIGTGGTAAVGSGGVGNVGGGFASGGASGLGGGGGEGGPHPTCPGDAANAYQGVAQNVNEGVEAEDFDSVGFSDATPGNEGAAYRTDLDVDIKAQGGGHVVGWMTAGEWLDYTVDVAVAGDYELTFRAGAVEAGRTLDLTQCGTVLGTVAVPRIDNWGTVGSSAPLAVHLEAGVQVLRVVVGALDYADLDRIDFELVRAGGGSGGTHGSGGTSGSGGAATGGTSGETCPLPATFAWTSTGPLAQPKNTNAKSLKDFSVTKYNGKYLVYGTTANGNWNGFMSTFTSFDEWDDAPQHYIPGLVAPTIFYFEPKDVWVLAYQWGFKYATSKTPDNPNSWSSTQPLLTGDPTGGRGTGPIDQTIICDDTDCYLFFNDDAGGVYRGSMPIGQFPGRFTNVTRILDEPTSLIFEGIQVYSIKGSDKYLMMIENNGTRAFRAWTADDLGGQWTQLAGANTTQQPFAGQSNVTWQGTKWTNDISHGDIVRENPSEKMEIDPCHLQLLYQGRDPNQNVAYVDLPYRPGLLTLVP